MASYYLLQMVALIAGVFVVYKVYEFIDDFRIGAFELVEEINDITEELNND